MPDRSRPVLVTGATGYVGGRLAPRLLEAGYKVRTAGRSINKLASRSWASHPNIELIEADVMDAASLKRAMQGCWAAYYLVHSMSPGQKDFAGTDRIAARNVVQAAEVSSLERIIYLGGLGEEAPNLSEHLRSRAEVAGILQQGKVPATVLRAAMIIGSGSASFEILRYLVDRLPLMITPRWVSTPCQPIAIRNVLEYLIRCLSVPETTGQTFDIGGADVLTYRELMEIYAEEAALPKRLIIPVPVFTPRLSSYWIHLVTPLHASIARPLAEGLKNPVVCHEHRIHDLIPQPLLTCRESIRLALDKMAQREIETHWTDAGVLKPPETVYPGDPHWSGGAVYTDKRQVVLQAPFSEASALWKPIIGIGGMTGWYYGNWLWKLRGAMDILLGGIGLRRGRRHPTQLMPGDALDFWRVLNMVPPHHLLLIAEMRVPGEAFLEFEIKAVDSKQTEIRQTARFVPKGLLGMLYWVLVTPLHHFVFNGLLRGIAEATGKPIVSGPKTMT